MLTSMATNILLLEFKTVKFEQKIPFNQLIVLLSNRILFKSEVV